MGHASQSVAGELPEPSLVFPMALRYMGEQDLADVSAGQVFKQIRGLNMRQFTDQQVERFGHEWIKVVEMANVRAMGGAGVACFQRKAEGFKSLLGVLWLE